MEGEGRLSEECPWSIMGLREREGRSLCGLKQSDGVKEERVSMTINGIMSANARCETFVSISIRKTRLMGGLRLWLLIFRLTGEIEEGIKRVDSLHWRRTVDWRQAMFREEGRERGAICM